MPAPPPSFGPPSNRPPPETWFFVGGWMGFVLLTILCGGISPTRSPQLVMTWAGIASISIVGCMYAVYRAYDQPPAPPVDGDGTGAHGAGGVPQWTPDSLNQRLMAALGFCEADVIANREGRITPDQIARIQHDRRSTYAAILGVSLCFLVVFGLGCAFPPRPMNGASMLCMVVVMVGLGGLALMMLRGYMTKPMAHEVFALDRTQGVVTLRADSGPRGGVTYQIIIGELTFRVSREVIQAFHDHRSYCIFSTIVQPNGRVIVAAEALADGEDAPSTAGAGEG